MSGGQDFADPFNQYMMGVRTMNKPLTETREIYEGNGVHGPMLEDEHGRVITSIGMFELEPITKTEMNVLVLDGPARKPTWVPAIGLRNTYTRQGGPGE